MPNTEAKANRAFEPYTLTEYRPEENANIYGIV